jgi:subtilisin family serine protease
MIIPENDNQQKPKFEPGIVQIEIKEGTNLKFQKGTQLQIIDSSGKELSHITNNLNKNKIKRIEPTFMTIPEKRDSEQDNKQQKDIPNLKNFYTLYFPEDIDVTEISKQLKQFPEIIQAAPMPTTLPPSTPLNEPLVGNTDQIVLDPTTNLENQWYIFRCRANTAWNRSIGNNVVIADIDWGFLTTHQDLVNRLEMNNAHNSFDNSNVVDFGPHVFHGTGVMGLAGADDNNIGMAGFAFGAALWPIQGNAGPGPAAPGNTWANAIDFVRQRNSNGRRVVIILEVQTGSFGNIEGDIAVNAAIRTAINDGIVVCVAAGNGDRDVGIDDLSNPITPTGSILVGATIFDPTQNRRANFSNWGEEVVVSAPGDLSHDLTCLNTNNAAYRNGFGGTSGATPKVAGIVALMLSLNPNLTHNEIREILNTTGTDIVTAVDRPVGTFLDSTAAINQIIQVTTIQVDINTNTGSGASTNGKVYLGVAGREFRLNKSGNQFEGGLDSFLVLTSGSNDPNEIKNPDEVNSLNGINAPTIDSVMINRSPKYIRFEPQNDNDNLQVNSVIVTVTPSGVLPQLRGPVGGNSIWLGNRSGLFMGLEG